MIKVDDKGCTITGSLESIFADFGLLTTKMLQTEEIPNKVLCKTIKLAFEVADVNIMDLITCDVGMTEELKKEIESQREKFEKESD